ncbi:MAG: hypothetical protein ACRD4A_04230 [Candidatus Acidiferrales bacterium]
MTHLPAGRLPNPKLEVLVVWEPILPTDWRKPTSGTLARISDLRAAQFWDPHHVVSREFKRDWSADGVPLAGHASGGSYWNLAVVYPPGAQRTAALPAPSFAGGDVVTVAPRLATKLRSLAASR